MNVPVDDRLALAAPPLRSTYLHQLRRGASWVPGANLRRLIDRSGETPQRDGAMHYQSTKALTWRLLVEAKSQRVWTPDQLLAELRDRANVGGAWLRCQLDPLATFWSMWDDAVQHDPQPSTEQATLTALAAMEGEPGIRLNRLREIVGGNRGRLDQMLTWLTAHGYVREMNGVRPELGDRRPGRWFYLTEKGRPVDIARALTRTLSLALMGLESLTRNSGHRTTAVTASGARRDLLMDKRMRARGVRVWLGQAASRRREARQAGREALRAREATRTTPPPVTHGPQTPAAARIESLLQPIGLVPLDFLEDLLTEDGPPAPGPASVGQPLAATPPTGPFTGSAYLDLLPA